MKPFDLAAALAGEHVVTRDGRRVFNLAAKEDGMIVGYVEGSILGRQWSPAGGSTGGSELQLFMVGSSEDALYEATLALGKAITDAAKAHPMQGKIGFARILSIIHQAQVEQLESLLEHAKHAGIGR